jgi:hypothetical protein
MVGQDFLNLFTQPSGGQSSTGFVAQQPNPYSSLPPYIIPTTPTPKGGSPFGDMSEKLQGKSQGVGMRLYALGGALRGDKDFAGSALALQRGLQQQELLKKQQKDLEEVKEYERRKRVRSDELESFKKGIELPEGLSTGGKILFTANKLSEAGYLDEALPYYELSKKYETSLTSKDKFEFEKNLRSEYDKKSKDIVSALDQARTAKKALEQGTGIGDIQAVFSFMKAVDPGSRVTEGEIELTAAAGGKLRTLAAFANKAATGKVFDSATRQEMWQLMSEVTKDSIQNLDSLQTRYTGLSSEYGIDPENVISPYSFDINYVSTPLYTVTGPNLPTGSVKSKPY